MTDEDAETAVAAPRPAAAGIAAIALALTALVVFGIWFAHDGGFAPEQWLPGAILFVALLAISLLSSEIRGRLVAAPVAPLLFGLYVIWSYASIIWARVPADAWDGANRTFLYFCAFVLFLVLPLGRRTRTVVVACFGFGIATIGLVEFLRAAAADGPRGFFVLGRFASPIAYSNANATAFGMSFFVLQALAARRGTPGAVRVLAAAASVVVFDLAVLDQSRGSAAALVPALLVYLLVGRNLLRALVQLALVAVPAALATRDLLDVYRVVVNGGDYAGALSTARAWVLGGALAAAAAAAVLVALDHRVVVPDRVARRIRRGVVGLAGAVAVVGTVAYLLVGHPGADTRRAWNDFSSNRDAPATQLHITSGIGTSRYDVWRIGLDQFAAHPLLGVGSDNYLVGFLEKRRTGATARYPESIVLRAFSETGLIGAVLFFGFLGVAFRGAVRAARAVPAGGAALAALAGATLWLFHASLDWLWEFPALAAPALALLGLAVGSAVVPARRAQAAPTVRRYAFAAAVAACALAGAGALFCPWIAVRDINAAVATAPADPAGADALLRSAADWNPLSDNPALTGAALAANVRDRPRERAWLNAALKRNASNWYTYLMLGIVDGREQKKALAHADLAKAKALSPLDPVVHYAEQRLHWGIPLTEQQVAAVFDLRSAGLRGVVQR